MEDGALYRASGPWADSRICVAYGRPRGKERPRWTRIFAHRMSLSGLEEGAMTCILSTTHSEIPNERTHCGTSKFIIAISSSNFRFFLIPCLHMIISGELKISISSANIGTERRDARCLGTSLGAGDGGMGKGRQSHPALLGLQVSLITEVRYGLTRDRYAYKQIQDRPLNNTSFAMARRTPLRTTRISSLQASIEAGVNRI